MNIKHHNSIVPARALPRGVRLASFPNVQRLRTAAVGATTLVGSLMISVAAFAQAATPSTAGIGAQMQNMAQEGSTTGGFVASMAMYVGALICFVGGVWALWQSRQPQSREPGKVAMGAAGIALCGLLVTGGTWINKAANTASGTNATVSSTAGTVTFGNG